MRQFLYHVVLHKPYFVTGFNPRKKQSLALSYTVAKNTHFRGLTLRVLMSYIYIYIYIYMEHPFLMFLDHTQRRTTVGRTLLDE